MKELPQIKTPDLKVDWNFLAIKLWSFIGDRVTGIVHQRRQQLTLGEEYNGLELWRALFIQNKGGAEQVGVAGMSAFHQIPTLQTHRGLATSCGRVAIDAHEARAWIGRRQSESHVH